MDIRIPISEIMTQDLITISPEDSMLKVKRIFEKNRIHHLPVIDEGLLVGMVSKTDLLHFMHGFEHAGGDDAGETDRLNDCKVKEIMVKGLAKLEPEDRLDVALEVFKENLFHAIPVVKNGHLRGMVTTLDVIRYVSKVDQPNG